MSRRLAVFVASALAVLGAVLAPSATPAGAAGEIHPGVETLTEGAQCTANFIFRNGADTFIGQAAHCAGTGAATETDGCLAGSLPLGTAVEIDGATQPGTLVYSSWLAMQGSGETNADACAHNDFALVRIAAADVARVDPSVPHWGGPVAVAPSAGTALGDQVYSYGNSSLRLGLTLLSPKTGISFGSDAAGWNHPVVLGPAPDIPGDSGSGLLDSSGRALGVLSHLSVGIPDGVRNNYSDLGRAISYARAHGFGGLTLVPGTAPFNGSALPLGL